MAVQYIIRKVGPFVGDGITTTFSFNFKVMKEADIKVYRTLSAEDESSDEVLALGVDYTASLNSDQDTSPGGSITLTAPLASGFRLAIISGEIPDQQVVLTNHDGFLPATLNNVHDKAIILIQDLWERVARAIILQPTDLMTPSELREKIFEAAESAVASKEGAAAALAACEAIKQYIAQYSWDIPHLVNSLRDVEAYPFDGLFLVGGFGNPGHKGQNISNRYVLAEGGTELRTLGERFGDVVNVRDFGAKGNGTADDTESINAALSFAEEHAYSYVVFPRGTYKVSGQLDVPGNCTLDGRGSRIISSASSNIFKVEGGGLGSQVALGANATTGDTSLTTASAHGLSAGDMALLWSQRDSLSEAAGEWRLGYHQGLKCYFAEPVSIKATPSTTSVTLDNGLLFPGYRTDATEDTGSGRTAATLAKLNFAEDVCIRNFVLDHNGSGAAIQALYAKNFVVDNVVVNTGASGTGVTAVSLFACYRARVNGVSVFGDKTLAIETGDTDFWKWTAVGVSSCWYVLVTDCHYGNVANGTDFTFQDGYWCSLFCSMTDSFVIEATAVPATSHPGVYGNEFSHNTFINCRTALTIRSRAARIIGNEITKSEPSTDDEERAIVTVNVK